MRCGRRRRAKEAIYEKDLVKRGGRGFSRIIAPLGAVRADGVGTDFSRLPSRGGAQAPLVCRLCDARPT